MSTMLLEVTRNTSSTSFLSNKHGPHIAVKSDVHTFERGLHLLLKSRFFPFEHDKPMLSSVHFSCCNLQLFLHPNLQSMNTLSQEFLRHPTRVQAYYMSYIS